MAFTYRSRRESAETLERELSARCRTAAIHADLLDEESVGSALRTVRERFGAVDSVIFATGANILQPYVSEISAQQWDEVVQVELIGFTRVLRAALPLMRAQGGGTIVAIGSFATYSFPPGDALSAVPKAAIEMLCRAVAREEGRYGIRANVVAPGIINALDRSINASDSGSGIASSASPNIRATAWRLDSSSADALPRHSVAISWFGSMKRWARSADSSGSSASRASRK